MRVGITGPYHTLPLGTQQACSRFVRIRFLVGDPIYFLVEPKTKTKDLYTHLCSYLQTLGMRATDHFGLSVLLEGEYIFVDPDYKLSKYAPKSWKSSSTNGLDSNGKPMLELFFQVQFYVENPLLLQDELSIEHYFAQIVANVLERGLRHPSTAYQAFFILAGLALQAQYGDTSNPSYYNKPHMYLPKQLVDSCGTSTLSQIIASFHRAQVGLTKTQARVLYIKEASSVDTFAVPHNTHLYRLRTSKCEPPPGNVFLAICTKGIELYQENTQESLNGSFLWNDIGKLSFDRKKFEIRGTSCGSSKKLAYYTGSDEKSKHLLSLCKVTHQYSMTIQPKLAQIRRREELGRKHWRGWAAETAKAVSSHSGDSSDQRISVISLSSSTTTSSILSDRGVQSLEENEATVVDGPTNNAVPNNTPPANTAEGSQCSSSASTVVTKKKLTNNSPTINNVGTIARSESVSSSLELGYSHTAQHSTLSESFEADFSLHSAHTSSGVYTIDESCDNHTTCDTIASSSGIGLESQGLRSSRSGSIISNTGSFHGDGSDPSETGRGNLLTAEELSNLIVHRSPKPRRGIYPTRATVSSTLDSCSDYVTLPPPPLPPSRTNPNNEHNYVMLNRQSRHIKDNYHSHDTIPQFKMIQQEQHTLDDMRPLNSVQNHNEEESNSRLLLQPNEISDVSNSRFLLHKLQIKEEEMKKCLAQNQQRNIHHPHQNYLQPSHSFSHINPRLEPSDRMKLNASMIPIVGSNNYLDVRNSYLQQYHQQPQAVSFRAPPPPPPRTNFSTVYTSQVTRSQIEQFNQQLYSDTDYVMYPIKDPSVSKQEYIDSKVALCYRQGPPPPYMSKHNMYRSTPNVAETCGYLPLYTKQLTINKFASNQNLSDYYPQSVLSSSLLDSAATSYSSSSSHSLWYDPLRHPPLRRTTPPPSMKRMVSHDNILVFGQPKDRCMYRRAPPPIPTAEPVRLSSSDEIVAPEKQTPAVEQSEKSSPLDISSLMEKSRNLDLPLISALCNDKSLLKQTNAFVMPHHPCEKERPISWHFEKHKHMDFPEMLETPFVSNFESPANKISPTKTSKQKYPVSGLSTNQIGKTIRKPISSHKHPEPRLITKLNRSQSTGSSSKEIVHY